jgi:hypothetical protein
MVDDGRIYVLGAVLVGLGAKAFTGSRSMGSKCECGSPSCGSKCACGSPNRGSKCECGSPNRGSKCACGSLSHKAQRCHKVKVVLDHDVNDDDLDYFKDLLSHFRVSVVKTEIDEEIPHKVYFWFQGQPDQILSIAEAFEEIFEDQVSTHYRIFAPNGDPLNLHYLRSQQQPSSPRGKQTPARST